MNALLQQIANPMVADPGQAFRQSFQTGRQTRLQDIALQQQQEDRQRALAQEQEFTQSRERLGQSMVDGQYSSDEFKQFALEYPEEAKKIQSVFQGVDAKDLQSTFYNIYAAGAVGGEDQNTLLMKARESLPRGHFLTGAMDDLIAKPPGKEKDKEIFGTIQMGQKLGFLPAEKAAVKTAEQIERELKAKELSAQTGAKSQTTREKELEVRRAEAKAEAGKLTPTMEKILDTAHTKAFESEKTANSLNLLADDFAREKLKGGVKVSISEFLKDALGSQDEVSMIRRKFRGIRASQATKNLPPGPASDKDIALALSGFPPENAGANIVTSFLRGAAKLAKIEHAYERFKAEYISDNASAAGMIKAWNKEKTDRIDEALSGLIDTGQEKIVFRHPELGDITEADITRTMKDNNMTREQVLTKLGAK